MPVYEYRCNACSREFEAQQRMSDPDLVTCETCGQDKLERLISRTAFQLKGSGWYKDLYSSSKPEKSTSDGAKSDSSTSSTSSSDSSSSSTPSTPATPSTPSTPSTGGGSSGSSGGTTKSAAAPVA